MFIREFSENVSVLRFVRKGYLIGFSFLQNCISNTVFLYILDDNFRIYINRQGSDYINAIPLPVSTYLLTIYFFNHIKLSTILLEN